MCKLFLLLNDRSSIQFDHNSGAGFVKPDEAEQRDNRRRVQERPPAEHHGLHGGDLHGVRHRLRRPGADVRSPRAGLLRDVHAHLRHGDTLGDAGGHSTGQVSCSALFCSLDL